MKLMNARIMNDYIIYRTVQAMRYCRVDGEVASMSERGEDGSGVDMADPNSGVKSLKAY